MSQILEQMQEKALLEVTNLKEKYAPQMEAFESSLLAQTKGGRLDTHDYLALGKSLEQFDAHREIAEAEGSLSLLGTIPTVAYDVITVSMGTSIIPTVASVQPIQDERGAVYFMNIKSTVTKGNFTAGDNIFNPKDNPTLPNGYAASFVTDTWTTTDADLQYDSGSEMTALAQVPIRPQLVTISVATTPVITLTDDGAGKLVGVGAYGDIDYTTGAYSITFLANPGAVAVTVNYQVNLELQTTLPGIEMDLTSTPVIAKPYALRGSIGLMQSFVGKQRFNLQYAEMLSSMLVQQINAEIGGDIIRTLRANIPSTSATTWDYTPPTGVPEYQHRLSFDFKLNDIESIMTKAAGRGALTAMIAGTGACSIIASQAKFSKITDGASIGPVIFGTLDGKIVVRVPDANILPSNEIICIYKGTNNPFEAPIVYSPFMPLTVTDLIPNINALTQQRAAAVIAGVTSVFPKFTAKITINNLPSAL